MPLPMSKSALDRLGRKLAADAAVSDDELDQLADVVRAYQVVLDDVKAQLVALGFEPTTRVKTTGTLVDKLRREHGMRLSRVQDLAGARILVPGRREQDEARDRICGHFSAAGSPCRVTDRRENPSHGYRAVHVIVQAGGIPVEIQIRTEMQDSWAQIVERVGDRWGRGLRYGDGPDAPDAEIRIGTMVVTRQTFVSSLMDLSNGINAAEAARAGLHELEAQASIRAVTDMQLANLDDPQLAERARDLLSQIDKFKGTLAAFEERQRLILRGMAQATDETGDAT
jgi:Region found in RelA / SpoT proteins